MRKLLKAMICVMGLLILLAAGTVHAQAAWDGTAATGFYSGSGTQASPYVIKTEKHLAYFANQINADNTFADKYISLQADLDMTGGTWAVTAGKEFAGTFLGNNHTVTMNARFLYKIAEGGTVDWLNLTATETLSDPLLCQLNYGTIQNCRVRGDVYANPGDVSLLCVYNYAPGAVLNSCGFGSLTGYGDDSDCYAGWIEKSTGTIKNCYTVLTLFASSPGSYNESYKGGIAASGSYENCYTDTAVIPNDAEFVRLLNQTTAIPGYIWKVDTANVNEGYPVIDDCLAATTSLSASTDPMFTYTADSLATSLSCSMTGCTVYYTLDGTDPTTSSTRKTFTGSSLTLNGDTVVTSVAYKNGEYGTPTTQYAIRMPGSGTDSDPYQISTNLGLYAIRFEPDKVYQLTADLDFTDAEYVHNGIAGGEWVSIPAFSGTLKGNNHSITGLSSVAGGFIHNISEGGTVQELRLLDHGMSNEKKKENGSIFGALADTNSGTVTRCYVSGVADGYITYSDYVGGIVGNNTYSGTISYCNSAGTVSASSTISYSHSCVGGVAGGNGGTIRNCYSDAKLNMCRTTHDLGATVGGITTNYTYGKVYDCRFDGDIYIPAYDAWVGIGAAVASGGPSYNSYRCYDGGATITGSNGNYHHAGENDLYKATGTGADLMELNFPAYDFDTVWMITPEGPMPQGVMRADGTWYTKTSYTAPGIDRTGQTLCRVSGTGSGTKTFSLPASGMEMGMHGDNLIWKRTEDGALTITGSGEMIGDDIWDFPWYADPITDEVIASQITSIEIGRGVTNIPPYAFYKTGATSITIPDTVTSIGNYAFDRSGITEFTIPASVKSIGYSVFYGKNGFPVTFLGDAPVFASDAFWGASLTAHFPADNETWALSVLQDYDGTVEWVRDGECSHKSAWCTTEGKFDPDCVNEGYSGDKVCGLCGAMVTKGSAVDPWGHIEVSHEAQAPTCTAIGWDAYVTCSRCDYTTYAEKPALGHDEIAHEAKAPTCTAIGWEAYVDCSRCDYTTYVEKPALGHDEIAHEAKAPACTEIGWDAYVTCSRCDYTTYVEKPALGHDEIAHEAKAPACTEVGWDAYVTCSRCDYTTYVEKAALGHAYDPYGVCSRCGENEPVLPFHFAASYARGLGGDTVEIRINVKGNPGIIAASVGVSYDEEKLALVEAKDTALLKGSAFGKDCGANPYWMRWEDAAAETDNAETGTVAVLKFRIAEDCPVGKIPVYLELSDGEIYNAALAPVEADTVTGCIEVVDCLAGDANEDGKVNSLDATLLRRYLAKWDNVQLFASAMDMNDDGAVNSLDVTILRRQLTPDWSADTQEKEPQAEPMCFTVSGVSGTAGEEVEVTVSLENNPGIIAACMELGYDSTKLELMGVTDGRVLGDSIFSQTVAANPYVLRWEESLATDNNAAEGVLVTLTFRILEDCEPGALPLELSFVPGEVYDLELQPVAFEVRQGTVTVEEEKTVTYDAETGTVTLYTLPAGTETVLIAAYNDGQLIGIVTGELGDNLIPTAGQADALKVMYLNGNYQPAAEAHLISLS